MDNIKNLAFFLYFSTVWDKKKFEKLNKKCSIEKLRADQKEYNGWYFGISKFGILK